MRRRGHATRIRAQKVIRKQANESDYDFLGRIAAENGWDMLVEHDGPPAVTCCASRRRSTISTPTSCYAYGRSLIDFSPRVSTGRADRQRSAVRLDPGDQDDVHDHARLRLGPHEPDAFDLARRGADRHGSRATT